MPSWLRSSWPGRWITAAKLIGESLIRPFEQRGRVVTPRFGTWKRADGIMARLVHEKRTSAAGFGRSFVNDCLLGASWREDGFALITRNVRDFALIQEVERFDVVEPWPA